MLWLLICWFIRIIRWVINVQILKGFWDVDFEIRMLTSHDDNNRLVQRFCIGGREEAIELFEKF
jgi:hypothetical protein